MWISQNNRNAEMLSVCFHSRKKSRGNQIDVVFNGSPEPLITFTLQNTWLFYDHRILYIAVSSHSSHNSIRLCNDIVTSQCLHSIIATYNRRRLCDKVFLRDSPQTNKNQSTGVQWMKWISLGWSIFFGLKLEKANFMAISLFFLCIVVGPTPIISACAVSLLGWLIYFHQWTELNQNPTNMRELQENQIIRLQPENWIRIELLWDRSGWRELGVVHFFFPPKPNRAKNSNVKSL
jgi:hypothetical protein